MSKHRAMGRPKLPPNETRNVFPLRLSSKEKDKYKLAALCAKEALPDWIRKTLTEAANAVISRDS